MRDVFQRISKDSNYMVVLFGKLNFKERMAEDFSPLNRFFPSSELTPLNSEDIRTYIKKKLDGVNVKISDTVIEEIVITSAGHPYVVVSICYLLFRLLGEDDNQISLELYKNGLPLIKEQLAQDFFISLYHPLSPNAKHLILSLAKNLNKLKFSFKEVMPITNLERNQVAPYIQQLVEKGCLNRPSRGEYEFFHPLFLEFLKTREEEIQRQQYKIDS